MFLIAIPLLVFFLLFGLALFFPLKLWGVPWKRVFTWAALALAANGLAAIVLSRFEGVMAVARPWMIISDWLLGVAFISFWLGGSFLVLQRILGHWWPQVNRPLAWIFLVMGLLLVVVGTLKSQALQVRHLRLSLPYLEQPMTLVLLTDLHLGLVYRERFLDQIAQALEGLNFDALVITGDVFDRGTTEAQIQQLGRLHERIFFVWGNHGHYFGVDRATAWLANTPIRVLTNERVSLGPLDLVGLDYLEMRHAASPAEVLASLPWPEDRPCVLLSHTPLDFSVIEPFPVHLQLSGHTHGGQIWPFGLVVRQKYAQLLGLYQQNAQMTYVSPGTGSWGPPIRLGTHCEITVVTVVPES
jgi:hypothetical protein